MQINYPSILQDCRAEEARWERNWTALRGEFLLDSIKATLSPRPPSDFFTQSYEEAFRNYDPSSYGTSVPRSCIQSSSNGINTNIANLVDMEKDLYAQITRLETVLGPINPVITGTGGGSPHTTPRKTSLRKSLPPTPITTPGSSPRRGGTGLEFTRSYSRLERRTSESPLSARGLASEHGIIPSRDMGLMVGNTLESLKNALSELEGKDGDVGKGRRGEKVERTERSNIPRRHMSVNLR